MTMPAFPGPFLDARHCESTGGGWLMDSLEGYSRWQMEQVGIDDRGWVQIRFEVRGGKLSCPVSFVNAWPPEYVEASRLGSLSSSWQLLEGQRFRGAAEREFETFLQECYAERINDDDCNKGTGNNGMGVWDALSNSVNGVDTLQSFAIINSKVFDIDTWELLE